MRGMRFLAILLAAVLAGPAAAEDEIGLGLPAPTFTVKTLNPDVAGVPTISLGQLVGPEAEDPGSKLVLLTFFASWCKPCQKEMPFLIQLDRMYREQGLRVIAVNIDAEPPGIELAKKQIAEAGVKYPVLSDRFNFLARRYLGEKAPLPSVFLINREGNITRIERGYSADVSTFLLAEVQAALGLKPARGPASPATVPASAPGTAQRKPRKAPRAKPAP